MAGYKPLCFLKHTETQPRQRTGETNTHGEDFLRLPTRSHVGVVDLFEDHPSLVMLPHLTGGRAREQSKINSWDHPYSHCIQGQPLSYAHTHKSHRHAIHSFNSSEVDKDHGSHNSDDSLFLLQREIILWQQAHDIRSLYFADIGPGIMGWSVTKFPAFKVFGFLTLYRSVWLLNFSWEMILNLSNVHSLKDTKAQIC